MFYFQELSRKIVYSIKVSILLIFFIGLCSLNTESAYAYNIFQPFSNNSLFTVNVRVDSIIRIDKGFVAHLYEYQDAQSSNISHESKLLRSPANRVISIAYLKNWSVRVACRRHSGNYLNKQVNNFSFIKSNFLNP